MTLARSPVLDPLTDRTLPYRMGQPGGRLLAGRPPRLGAEPLRDHAARLGPLPLGDPRRVLEELERSGLTGRGGGGFPVARKLAAARAAASAGCAHHVPHVVVNASESEPASVKDRTLCTLRPHLVLDGAAVAAAIAGANRVVVYAHRGTDRAIEALRLAVAERRAAGLPDPAWLVGVGPARYVSGEASAAASWLEGGEAKPRALRLPLAVGGIAGRPTVVHNVETMAHVALIVRFGADWWRQAGTMASPGSRLVTVHRGGPRGAELLEMVAPLTVGTLLTPPAPEDRDDGGLSPSSYEPGAVLIGGYAGRWAAADAVEGVPFTSDALAAVGLAPGCGVVAPLPKEACGVAAMATLAQWLAAESAGQCGPCLFGLADVAEGLQRLTERVSSRREVRNLRLLLGDIRGKGACHHPDGVVGMVESGLDVFADDVDRHARRRPCGATADLPAWPFPAPEEAWR